MSEHKTLALRLPDDAPPGTVVACFSTFGIRDKQGDIVRKSAFDGLAGVKVPLIWSHAWDSMAVGLGEIRVKPQQAEFHGAFHLQTDLSRDAYATVKAMGDLQEYSYGFDVAAGGSAFKEDADGQLYREITQFKRIYEVSPVLVGAGEDTRTLSIKSDRDDEKPFANEHACRLKDPGDFQQGSFRRLSRDHNGKPYGVIMGRLQGETTMTEQAYRYPAGAWTAAQARSHCSSHDGTEFAAATGGSSGLTPEEQLLDAELHAQWTAAFINNLPDSSFAYIAPGGSKDAEGKTTPRSLRHFPHHNADGSLDLPHLRNALARAPQSDFGPKAMPHLEAHARGADVGDHAHAPDGEKVGRTFSAANESGIRGHAEGILKILDGVRSDAADAGKADAPEPPAIPGLHPAAAACAALRACQAWLAATPLDDVSAGEWAASVTARMDDFRQLLLARAAKAHLPDGRTPRQFYDRIQERDAQLRAVLGKDH